LSLTAPAQAAVFFFRSPYLAHYLESVLAGDIKKVRERWSEEAQARRQADLNAGRPAKT